MSLRLVPAIDLRGGHCVRLYQGRFDAETVYDDDPVRVLLKYRELGARYVHVFVPCPLGWGHASEDTIRISRLAKETGLFPVFEAEHGEVVSVSKIRRQLPVEEYLKPQKRFAHLFRDPPRVDVIARIQEIADRNIRRYGLADA